MRARIAIAACVLAACTSGATTDPGLGARLRVKGAQYVSGALPAGSESGPKVGQILLPNNNVHASFADDPLSGALDPTATAAALALEGDPGYWIVPAGAPAVATPNNPSLTALLAFSSDLPPGPYTLVAQAVDANGVFGPPFTQDLTATAIAIPTGAVVVTLTWDAESDLDLHVLDPLGNELDHGTPSSAPPLPFGGDAGSSNGYLDFDSNGNCAIDGRRQEDVIWPTAAPPGHYVVRVDTASLCGKPIAHWAVSVTVAGAAAGSAAGTSVDTDTRGAHDRGAGITTLEFDVP